MIKFGTQMTAAQLENIIHNPLVDVISGLRLNSNVVEKADFVLCALSSIEKIRPIDVYYASEVFNALDKNRLGLISRNALETDIMEAYVQRTINKENEIGTEHRSSNLSFKSLRNSFNRFTNLSRSFWTGYNFHSDESGQNAHSTCDADAATANDNSLDFPSTASVDSVKSESATILGRIRAIGDKFTQKYEKEKLLSLNKLEAVYSFRHFRYSLILFVIYFITGLLYYGLDHHFTTLDTFYFIVITFFTIG